MLQSIKIFKFDNYFIITNSNYRMKEQEILYIIRLFIHDEADFDL